MAFLVDDLFAVSSMPTPSPAVSPGFFSGGSPGSNIPATTISVDWLNMITAELTNAVIASGQTLSKTNTNQLSTAILRGVKSSPGLEYMWFSIPTQVTGGTTIIVGPGGISAVDAGASFIVPVASSIVGLYLSSTVAPGGTQSVTATAYVNGVASAAVATCTGTATSASYSGSIALSATNGVSIHVTTSASAAATYVRGYVTLQPT